MVYCGSGVTACHNLLALEHAGIQGVKISRDPGASGPPTRRDPWQPNQRIRSSSRQSPRRATDGPTFAGRIPVQPAMKTMTLRILFTLAILAGLAAAPDAQTFRWEPNRSHDDVGERVERAIDQAQRNVERQCANARAPVGTARAHRRARRRSSAQRNAERHAAHIERQVRASVQRADPQRDSRASQLLVSRAATRQPQRRRRYAEHAGRQRRRSLPRQQLRATTTTSSTAKCATRRCRRDR